MNQEQLNAIKDRMSKATPGPWKVAYDTDDRDHVVDIWFDGEDNGYAEIHDNGFGNAPDNAKFISHAREDVPALVAEIERLREALEFYADEKNHIAPIFDEHGQYNGSKVDKDGGEIARQALVGESDVQRKQDHHT
ncbi:hypothetical protein NY607_01815 [Lysinibacillus sp. A4]|uniref:hypothetical protein n=1 Tax=Lysinibacillus sp. A4 TaxID=2976269 RepID=UPI0021760B4B|nr:hypothetical protein [Lysinibacillus sp. A4]MCS5499840.1 hypothetical protein [Lysinibacillus sp. A4]